MIGKCFALRLLWTKLGEGSDLAAVSRPRTSLRNAREDGAHHVLVKLMQMAAHYERCQGFAEEQKVGGGDKYRISGGYGQIQPEEKTSKQSVGLDKSIYKGRTKEPADKNKRTGISERAILQVLLYKWGRDSGIRRSCTEVVLH